ncbi:MAG: dipeptide ABC transporter ATP-binding protein [Acidimicrobiales bacterium]
MTRPVLGIEDLSVAYETGSSHRLALDGVSLDLSESEIVGVVGESGCGKSTLGLAILQLLPANAAIVGGSVILDGRDLCRLGTEQMRAVRGQEVSMIFQDPTASLNPRLPIGTQLRQVQEAHREGSRRGAESLRALAIDKLEEVGLPDPARAFDRYPYEFSGGMRQRVMIAMALLLEPSVIIADEATSALDVTLEAQILELLLRLRDRHGTAMIYISHDLGIVSQLCDRVAVMYAGRFVEEVSSGQLLRRVRHPYSQALEAAIPRLEDHGRRLATIAGGVPELATSATSCTFASRCVCVRPICVEEPPGMYPVEDGKVRCFVYAPEAGKGWETRPSVDDWRSSGTIPAEPRRPLATQPDDDMAVLEVRQMSVHFATRSSLPALRPARHAVRAVDGVSLSLGRGRILGVVGESGSGKTTLAEAIVKLRSPTTGSLWFAGQDVTSLSTRDTHAYRRHVQMIFQSPQTSLSPRMNIGSIVSEPYEVFGIPRRDRAEVDELLDTVGLPSSISRMYPNQVSGGQARRIGIARALVIAPELLVADEPTSGLDASSAGAIVNLLGDLRRANELSIVMISHNLAHVSALVDEVCVMYFGQIVEHGLLTDVMTTPAHPYTKALLALAAAVDGESKTRRRALLVPGEIPSPDAPPTGCKFHPRCAYRQDICRELEPTIGPVGTGSHTAACHFAREVQLTDISNVLEP